MQITFLLYEGMTALDAIGPLEVLSRLPGITIKLAGLQAGVIGTCSGLKLLADSSIFDIEHTDVLLVPGAGTATALKEYPELLAWIKKIHETTTWTISVCTGGLILGAAGLLTGVRATTHWAVMDRLAKWGAIATHQRVVESGKIITAAGVSAGIDMALLFAAKVAGEEVAKSIQLGIEYDPEPPFNSGSIEKASPEVVQALRNKLKIRFEQQ